MTFQSLTKEVTLGDGHKLKAIGRETVTLKMKLPGESSVSC